MFIGTRCISTVFLDVYDKGYSKIYRYTDAEIPVISGMPANINQNTDTNSNTAAVSWTPPTVTDNSGEDVSLASTLNPGHLFSIGTTTVTYTATDQYSNEAMESFDVIITGKFKLPVINYCRSA